MVEKSFVTAIDERIPLEVETDASEGALGATLSQDGERVAFFSRSQFHAYSVANSITQP